MALFDAQVQEGPERLALVDGQRQLTYGDVNAAANRLAHYLRSVGVGAEQRVGVLLPRTTELVVGLLGILKAGGAYVPLEVGYPEERLRYLLTDAGARVVLTAKALKQQLGEVEALRVVCVDEEAEAIGALSDANPACETVGSNLAYLIYTSGSTGQPKAVGIEHRSATTLLQWALEQFTAAELSVVLAGTAISFDLSVFEMFAPLSSGGMVVVAENALALPELAAGQAVTLLNTVPSAMKELLRLGAVPETTRAVNLAGEALSGQLVREIYEETAVQEVRNLYGPSEDTTYSTCARLRRESEGEPSIGRPIANTQAYVLDQRLEPVAIGVVGELYLGGAGLARGYLGQAALTAEKFVPHPFAREAGARLYRTGDLARYGNDGELEFLGRQDEQVKVRGYRIELGEIESVLREHEGVAAAVVVASSGQREGAGEAGRQLVAYVVAAAGEVAVGELRRYLRSRLPEYMVPAVFVSLEALPLTANGKINRRALAAQAEQELASVGSGAQGDRVRPSSVTEEILAGLWSAVLGQTEVSVTDNFFERGGHSLLAVQLLSRIRESFAVELELKKLFELPTIAQLAELIDEQLQAGSQLQLPPIVPVSRDRNLPLSFPQERLWFLNQLDPESPFYNIPVAVRLRGALHKDLLEQAFNEVVQRHEALRTTFQTLNGQAIQTIAPALTLPFAVLDLQALPLEEREIKAQQLMAEEARRPFDLVHGPLVRVSLLQLDEEEHITMLTMHHIVSDRWSIGILIQEVTAIYDNLINAHQSSLESLEIQYADFAVWQRDCQCSEMFDTQLAYWKEQLDDAAVLQLPTDKPRPVQQSFAGESYSFELPERLVQPLNILSRRLGVTQFMTLLAIFKVLLRRYSGQSDVVVGTAVASRNRLETEGLIGFFVNTLVLRTAVDDDLSFEELLRRVRTVTLSALAHQDVPFEKLVEELQPERSLSRSPLFQVMMVLENTPFAQTEMAGLRMSPIDVNTATARFDLLLLLEENNGGLKATLEYNTDLFERERMARLAEHFENLVASVVQDAGQRVGELRLLSAGEREQIVEQWNE
ncbi:MAG TPA: amino acid adenylation domain-containing protein, partial [Pyrinomonadaceae bacterium]